MAFSGVTISLLLLLLLHVPNAAAAAPRPTFQLEDSAREGGNNLEYPLTFQSGVKTLFATLVAKSTTTKFFNTTVSRGLYRIYGLFLCNDGISAKDCRSCIGVAADYLLPTCPNAANQSTDTCSWAGYAWYDRCFMHYSKEDFLGSIHGGPESISCSPPIDQTKAAEAMKRLATLIEPAWKSAAKFAAKVDVDGGRGLVQCTRDLSTDDCRACLEGGLASLGGCKWRDLPLFFYSAYCRLRYVLP